MLEFPFISPTPETNALTEKIFLLAEVIQNLPSSPVLQTRIFHQQFLKSALFSARIEGNTMTLRDAESFSLNNKTSQQKKEVTNILRILQQVRQLRLPKTPKQLAALHQRVMQGLAPDAGKFRHESSAIYDQFGNIVYLTPSPEEAQQMMGELFAHIKKQSDRQKTFFNIVACHYYFEKIHPFLDGNGRTGRVLLQLQLAAVDVFGGYIIPIDQYFDEHRSDYYFYLEKNTRRINDFVLFFLTGLVDSLEKIIQETKVMTEEALSGKNASTSASSANELLPRRQEILLILADHPFSSLDFLARRFPTLSRRTLAYDLEHLRKKNFIERHGSTRGASYSVAKK